MYRDQQLTDVVEVPPEEHGHLLPLPLLQGEAGEPSQFAVYLELLPLVPPAELQLVGHLLLPEHHTPAALLLTQLHHTLYHHRTYLTPPQNLPYTTTEDLTLHHRAQTSPYTTTEHRPQH